MRGENAGSPQIKAICIYRKTRSAAAWKPTQMRRLDVYGRHQGRDAGSSPHITISHARSLPLQAPSALRCHQPAPAFGHNCLVKALGLVHVGPRPCHAHMRLEEPRAAARYVQVGTQLVGRGGHPCWLILLENPPRFWQAVVQQLQKQMLSFRALVAGNCFSHPLEFTAPPASQGEEFQAGRQSPFFWHVLNLIVSMLSHSHVVLAPCPGSACLYSLFSVPSPASPLPAFHLLG